MNAQVENRGKNSFRNILTGFLGKVIVFLFAFVTRTIFIRLLGAEYTGVSGLYSNILQVLSLADLGIHTVLAYSLYQAIKDQNQSLIASLIHYYKKIYFIIGATVIIIGLSLCPVLHLITNVSISESRLLLYYILFLADTAASYFFVYRTTMIEADQKQYISNLVGVIASLLTYILQILYLLLVRDYIGFLIIQVLCTIGRNVVISAIVGKKYPFLKDKTLINDKQINKKTLFSNIKATFFY